MGTQGALVHTTQGGIRYAAYYDQGGPFEDFTGGEATNSCVELNRSKMSGISQVQTQHANFPEWDPRLLQIV